MAEADECRRGVERRCARGERSTLVERLIVLEVRVLRSDRRFEVDRRTELPGRRAGDFRREVPAAVVLRVHVADARRRALVRALVQTADMELVLARPVDTDGAFVLHPGERTP